MKGLLIGNASTAHQSSNDPACAGTSTVRDNQLLPHPDTKVNKLTSWLGEAEITKLSFTNYEYYELPILEHRPARYMVYAHPITRKTPAHPAKDSEKCATWTKLEQPPRLEAISRAGRCYNSSATNEFRYIGVRARSRGEMEPESDCLTDRTQEKCAALTAANARPYVAPSPHGRGPG